MVVLGDGWTKTVPEYAAGGTVTGATDALVIVECIGARGSDDTAIP